VIDEEHNLRVKFGGLEVYLEDEKEWTQVKLDPNLNALVINAGKML
jgi:isopenicillin N synthase-like dioxygenase